MIPKIFQLFNDRVFHGQVAANLPRLFQIAEDESSRAGKVGMEVGSIRERILIALLIHTLGRDSINEEIAITAKETDVEIDGLPLSIKTSSGSSIRSVKLIWTVDTEQAFAFSRSYVPSCDIMLAHINWNGEGGLHYFPVDVQSQVLRTIGRTQYIKLPKPGTNPRGVELGRDGILALMQSKDSRMIRIHWAKRHRAFDPYHRWLELWKEGEP